MTEYQLVAEPRADLDVAAAFHWYEGEEPGLGLEFLDQLKVLDRPDVVSRLKGVLATERRMVSPTRRYR